MKKLGMVLLLMLTMVGCRDSKNCTVTSYGSDYLILSGDCKLFNKACRDVLHEFSHKEELAENKTHYPYYGEGISTNKNQDGRLITSTSYQKTKDTEGYEYEIKTIKLAGKDPLVIVKTTNPNKFILINAIYQELAQKGIKVKAAP